MRIRCTLSHLTSRPLNFSHCLLGSTSLVSNIYLYFKLPPPQRQTPSPVLSRWNHFPFYEFLAIFTFPTFHLPCLVLILFFPPFVAKLILSTSSLISCYPDSPIPTLHYPGNLICELPYFAIVSSTINLMVFPDGLIYRILKHPFPEPDNHVSNCVLAILPYTAPGFSSSICFFPVPPYFFPCESTLNPYYSAEAPFGKTANDLLICCLISVKLCNMNGYPTPP